MVNRKLYAIWHLFSWEIFSLMSIKKIHRKIVESYTHTIKNSMKSINFNLFIIKLLLYVKIDFIAFISCFVHLSYCSSLILCTVYVILISEFISVLFSRYINEVKPGKYGIPKPFYFLFLSSYWCSVQRQKSLSVKVRCYVYQQFKKI